MLHFLGTPCRVIVGESVGREGIASRRERQPFGQRWDKALRVCPTPDETLKKSDAPPNRRWGKGPVKGGARARLRKRKTREKGYALIPLFSMTENKRKRGSNVNP